MRPEIVQGIKDAAAVIREASSLLVTGHISPDGDSLGSSLALALTARAVGKQAEVSFGGHFKIPEQYSFLDISPVVPHTDAQVPDVLVTFDVGDLDRIGEIAGFAECAATVVMIDHHLSTDGFGDINVNDPTAGAAAQLAFALIAELGWELTPEAAMALHVGMVTDTGRFQYSNTTSDVLAVASDLVAAGARPEVIGQAVYESVPFGYLGVAGAVMSRAVLETERSFIWSYVTQADLAEHGIGMDQTDPLIDAVRVARESDVAALAKQQPEGGWKVSLRSRGRVDVSAIAVAMGGGGHHNASGFSVAGDLDNAIDQVRSRLS
jgi:phosphoesterase RecJ-like protein